MLNLSKKILVAIDGSPPSDKAAEEAVRLAASTSDGYFRSKVFAVIVRAAKEDPALRDLYPEHRQQLESWAQREERIFYVVDKVARDLGVNVQREILYGEVEEQLLQFAERENCELIVIGSSGKGRLRRVLQGSISMQVAMKARCSVYLVR
ncbi:MAG: universal stress protein [Deltaproteobacteria bacterium]|nr:universal stress protein [Deltaproteobacteria bacterium]NCP02305.1 universal stress protein [Deltaproteobacteria bacterium]